MQMMKRSSCPACEQLAHRRLYEIPYSNAKVQRYLCSFYSNEVNGLELDDRFLAAVRDYSYVLLHCGNCDLIYQEYVPDGDMMAALYNSMIEPDASFACHEQTTDLDQISYIFAELFHISQLFGRRLSGTSMLDFGAGWGLWARMAQAFGTRVVICEVSPAKVRHASRYGLRNIAEINDCQERFDFINTEQVLEHLADPLTVTRSLANLLKPGGLLKISVPTAFYTARRVQRFHWSADASDPRCLNEVAPLEHLNTFNKRSLVQMCERSGLEYHSSPAIADRYSLTRRSVGKYLFALSGNCSAFRYMIYKMTGRRMGEYHFFRKPPAK